MVTTELERVKLFSAALFFKSELSLVFVTKTQNEDGKSTKC